MSSVHTTGLGEPQPIGKKALFKPATETEYSPGRGSQEQSERGEKTTNDHHRVRTTLELTSQALAILQDIQCSYRLKTGKVLPLWKLVSMAVEAFKSSNTNLTPSNPEPALHVPDGKRNM